MIKIIPAASRHYADFEWLKTYWLFSFAEYYDPSNTQFGPLRVFNDDVVAPGAGFPTHPHREMEIITIPLSGSVTHADSMGNRAVIGPGDVQRMTAGTGLTHSEFNLGEAPVHLYQIWIYPSVRDLPPSYDQRHFDPSAWRNALHPVASGQGHPDAVTFHADATIYRADLEDEMTVNHSVEEGRGCFVYVTRGALVCDDHPMAPGDQARIDGMAALSLTARGASGFILIDLPSGRGFGYDATTLRGARAR